MKRILFLSIILISQSLIAQQTTYNVTAGTGNGLRFWNSDTYKIHMGTGSEYQYGPVTTYSIKMNMSTSTYRGWTWGSSGNTPIAALNTRGDFQVDGFIKNYGPQIVYHGSTRKEMHTMTYDNNSAVLVMRDENEQPNIKLLANGISYINGGSMGIGTTSPGNAKLAVAGTIASTEIVVEINPGQGPDYVFEENYNLKPLEEVKEYISDNKHLPEIPSAKEMEENGVGLADMNMRLLKKIEELTLYQIELLEKLEQQDSALEDVKKELQALKES